MVKNFMNHENLREYLYELTNIILDSNFFIGDAKKYYFDKIENIFQPRKMECLECRNVSVSRRFKCRVCCGSGFVQK